MAKSHAPRSIKAIVKGVIGGEYRIGGKIGGKQAVFLIPMMLNDESYDCSAEL